LAQIKPGENGCEIWRGPLSSEGTPNSHLDGERLSARRIAYYYAHGEVPARAEARCGNRLCVALAHVTTQRICHRRVLEALSKGLSRYETAAMFGLNPSSVSHIKRKAGGLPGVCVICSDLLPARWPNGRLRQLHQQTCRGQCRIDRARQVKRATESEWRKQRALSASSQKPTLPCSLQEGPP
jgi:hypothetical protein